MTAANDELLEVLVVGAGPTGLTLAAQLRAFGATVRIVDRQLDRVHESRALGVQPRTLEVLRGLGVAEELVARGNDAVWVQLHVGGRVVRIRLFGLGLDDTAYPFLLFVSQAETEQLLGDHLVGRGVAVERGVELVGFHADRDAVSCTLRHRAGRTEQDGSAEGPAGGLAERFGNARVGIADHDPCGTARRGTERKDDLRHDAPQRAMPSALLPWVTCQPRARNAVASAARSPAKVTRITEVPPMAIELVETPRTPGAPRSAPSGSRHVRWLRIHPPSPPASAHWLSGGGDCGQDRGPPR